MIDEGFVSGNDLSSMGTHTYFPSIAVNKQGVAVIGFSASAPDLFAGAYVTYIDSTKPPGKGVGPSLTVAEGQDWYDRRDRTGRNRWGDYTGEFWVFGLFVITLAVDR